MPVNLLPMKIMITTKIKYLIISILNLALIACSGGQSSDEPISDILRNQAPTLTGSPPIFVSIGDTIDFTPTATDPDGDSLVFSIVNKPVWAEFSTSTGNLNGTPSNDNIGVVSNITITVSDGSLETSLSAFNITVSDQNRAPTISAQNLSTTIDSNLVITLGPQQDEDGDSLTYSVNNTSNISAGPQSNQVVFTSNTQGVNSFSVSVTDNIHPPVSASISVNVLGPVSSNFVTGRGIILPTYGSVPPLKGETRIDPITGTKITRLTDANELEGTSDALIVYSRYTPENSNGSYFLAFGANSTSSWVIERRTGQIVANLRYDSTRQIGEAHEVRWDTSGNFPNRVYYRNGMQFFMINDVTNQDSTRVLIKDFSDLVPNATKIYNDVEGDSSNDSDNWAWMASHYNGSTYVVDAFITYQISTDTVHTLRTSDLIDTSLSHYATQAIFPRPNMVEISPLGKGIVLHYGRAWGDASYGSRSSDIGTWFDGAHLWPMDFNFNTITPTKISVGETHSGWSYDENGNEYFISQNNRTDRLDAVSGAITSSGYDNRIEIASHSDFGWSNGFHYGKMPTNRKGWIFVNTYTRDSNLQSEWGANQLIMIQMKDETKTPIIWRIGSNYNSFSGDYRDEAPAAINIQGNRIYLSSNWGGRLGHREVFVFELPDDWDSRL